jgi:POT family proton-dependent oligopeptide transporter
VKLLFNMDTKRSLEVTKGGFMDEPVPLGTSASNSVDGETANLLGPFPTEEEFATLPRVPGSIPWTAWTVALVEFAERFSYYGTTAVCK